jgi:hypothetical protein
MGVIYEKIAKSKMITTLIYELGDSHLVTGILSRQTIEKRGDWYTF